MAVPRIVLGNIFDSPCQTITNPVNCAGIMGAGLALQFRHRFPEMHADYVTRCKSEVDRFFPSSRLCPMCGAIKDDQTLNDRIFVCECGHFADRDRNAAQNIERQALKMFAGVGSRRTETHVEQMLDSQEQSVMKRENMAEERRPSNPAVV